MVYDVDTNACICDSGFYMSILGTCRAESDNYLSWFDDNWSSCKGEWRHRKVLACSRDDKDSSSAPWWKRNCYRWKASETCNDPTVICKDWFAEYNQSTGVCECPAGYSDTDLGCSSWDNNSNDAGDKLMVEIQERLTHIYDEGSLSTINAKRLAAFERFFNNMEKKAIAKATSGCGSRGRSIHGNFIETHKQLWADFQNHSSADIGDHEALRELIYLYNHWQQLVLWNCPASGYGYDPLDFTDASGATCTNSNKKSTFKCRVQFQFDILFDRVFKTTPLEW